MLVFAIFFVTAPSNHSEAEDVYDFALKVETGRFADQAGVNRVLALPVFGVLYDAALAVGSEMNAFSFMICINRFLSIVCLCLFYQLTRRSVLQGSVGTEERDSLVEKKQVADFSLQATLLFAFSYGFWRYANEAETYILASALVLGSWSLAVKGRWLWAIALSSFGILVHLLNLIPLLLVLPCFYLLKKEWKKAAFHGLGTGVLVALGYGLCFRILDWGALGAQHHILEGGFSLSNLLRGGIGFGQCLVSGNFLFGFEWFRELLTQLFPSRMFEEEFYMASQVPSWIRWAGIGTLFSVVLCCLLFGIDGLVRQRIRWSKSIQDNTLMSSAVIWLFLYSVAILRTEAGSPELWIMATIPFWLIVGSLLQGVGKKGVKFSWILVFSLFIHNLIGGLLPVISAETDYHVAKGKWLVEKHVPEDLILMDYEPVMVSYLSYFTKARVVHSGEVGRKQIEQMIESRNGNAYAVGSFFKPMKSMGVRNPEMYADMMETGAMFMPRFSQLIDDEFGGIFIMLENGNE